MTLYNGLEVKFIMEHSHITEDSEDPSETSIQQKYYSIVNQNKPYMLPAIQSGDKNKKSLKNDGS